MTRRIALTCPECGPTARLVERRRTSDGKAFWGCPNYYREENPCRFTMEVPLDQQLRDAGARRLPGF